MATAALAPMLPTADTPLLEAALMYARAELAPVPLYGIRADGTCGCGHADCDPSNWGKHPIGREWQKRATLDPEDIRDRFAHHRGNLGIYLALGGYVLIDADGELGLETAKTWQLPETLSARTGGSGAHYIYRFSPSQDASLITDRNKFAPGLDVKVRGQFAAAPSLHKSGNRYAWTVGAPATVLPDWLFERIRKPVRAAPALPATTPSGDLEKRARAYLAKIPPAISGARGHDQAFAAARALAGWVAKGLEESVALVLLEEYNASCQPPWTERELAHKWQNAKAAHTLPALPDRERSTPRLRAIPGGAGGTETAPPGGGSGNDPDWRAELLWTSSKSGNDKLVSHVENVIRILQLAPEWKDRIGYDEFAARVLVWEPPWDAYQKPTTSLSTWSDEDGTRLCGWLRRRFHRYSFCPTVTECDRAVDVVARTHAYHPVRDYLESVTWDETSRLGTWLAKYLGAEQTPYLDMVGRWWLIGACARVFRPGVMVRTVPILEGPQELSKSTALKVLAGEAWVNDTPIDLGSKDAYQAIQGCWFVELAELDSLMRAEASRAKAFFSSGIDRYRPPYGRRIVESPRQCVFVGTVNETEYLDDPSGGTRYWPIRCGVTRASIDLEGLAAVRDQLWAEAVAAYHEGQLWYPVTAGERAVLGEQQDDRGKEDSWVQIISTWVRKQGIRAASVADILSGALGLDAKDQTKAAITRAGIIMVQRLRWVKTRKWEGGRRWYEYVAPDDVPNLTSNVWRTSE